MPAGAVRDSSSTWYLNFTSGVRSILGIPNIPSVSGDINNRLYNYFAASPLRGVRYGTVISDFVDKPIVQQQLRTFFEE